MISAFTQEFLYSQVIQSYSSTDMATAWKIFRFILSEMPGFYLVVILFIAVHPLPLLMLILFSVDGISFPGYVNWSPNFIRFLFMLLWFGYNTYITKKH